MKKLNGVGFIYLLLGIIIVASTTMVSGFPKKYKRPASQQTGLIVAKPPPDTGHADLQLKTFPFVTITPSPLPTLVDTPTPQVQCQPDSVKNNCVCPSWEWDGVVCENRQAGGVCPDSGIPCADQNGYPNPWGCTPNSCLYTRESSIKYGYYLSICGDHQVCYAKPVIYLYPTVDTLVTVNLTIPGYIYTSNPQIEKINAWSNVLAHQDGKLEYQGKIYHELFYESSVKKHIVPDTGVFIAKSQLKQKLLQYTYQLGLIPNEQQEFLAYWMPKLAKVNDPYIFFSVLTPQQKDSVDHVAVLPKPDTRIEFLAYFKGVKTPYTVNKLILPASPPKRIGFTEVEWGGTIDN